MTHRQDHDTTPGRLNAGANDAHVSVNVLATWDAAASLDDVEDVIKRAARGAVLRARELHQ